MNLKEYMELRENMAINGHPFKMDEKEMPILNKVDEFKNVNLHFVRVDNSNIKIVPDDNGHLKSAGEGIPKMNVYRLTDTLKFNNDVHISNIMWHNTTGHIDIMLTPESIKSE